MTYADTTDRLADASEKDLLTLYRALDREAFTVAAARVLARYNARATTLADLSLALTTRGLPVGLIPADETARLELSFRTLTERIDNDAPEIAEAKVARIARAEPLSTGRRAYRDAALRRGLEGGWTRAAAGNACDFCKRLADGTVLSWETSMADHPSCNCVQVPTGFE